MGENQSIQDAGAGGDRTTDGPGMGRHNFRPARLSPGNFFLSAIIMMSSVSCTYAIETRETSSDRFLA